MFKPTRRDLETIAELTHARAPISAIAAAVGVPVDHLVAWRRRCANAAAADAARWQRPEPVPVARPVWK
jgi:hypothetical protein